MNWIVKNPEKAGRYLTTVLWKEIPHIAFADWDGTKWNLLDEDGFPDDSGFGKVSAWMPLPEPFKG